jgi:anti-sigma factor RsiW
MSCEYYEELISADQDGELNQKERNELSLHLAVCADCRQFAERIKLFHKLSASAKPPLFPKARQRMILQKTIGSISLWSRIRSMIFGSYKVPRQLIWLGYLTTAMIIGVITVELISDKMQLEKSNHEKTSQSSSVYKLEISDSDIIAYNATKKVVFTEQDIAESKTIVFSDNFK